MDRLLLYFAPQEKQALIFIALLHRLTAGGFYIAIIDYDTVDCGSPIIPAGTILREFCAGYSKVQHVLYNMSERN